MIGKDERRENNRAEGERMNKMLKVSDTIANFSKGESCEKDGD